MRVRLGAVLLTVLAFGPLVAPPATAVPNAPVSHVLYDGGSSYPRVVRLPDGRLLVSVTSNAGSQGVGIIETRDGNGPFRPVARIRDPAASDGAGICCSTLYVLPSAVGALPAGTVLWADTTGYTMPYASRTDRQRLWASTDDGATWRFVSDIAVAPNHENTWEPSLSVAADGRLVAFYSDETDKAHHDQKLVQVRSADGVHWTDYRETVVSDNFFVRPGMASAIRLPDGGYFLAYEVCNNDKLHLCAAYFRRSADGWDYGDAHDLGTVVRTVAGRYGRHTPTLAWTPGPGPEGTILLITEMLVNADGGIAPGNGRTLLVNTDGGAGPWTELPAPVAVAGVNNGGCRNFSPDLLPSPGGRNVLEVTTDYDGTVCKTYSATGPLPIPAQPPVPAAASATPAAPVTAQSTQASTPTTTTTPESPTPVTSAPTTSITSTTPAPR